MRRFLRTCAKIPHFGMTGGGTRRFFASLRMTERGHSRESGNPESLEVCLEIRPGSPINTFGDDNTEIPQSVCENTALRNDGERERGFPRDGCNDAAL